MARCRHLPSVVRAMLILATVDSAAAENWELRSETVYSSGNYGSGIETQVLYAPLEIRRKFEWGEVGLSVPYLWYRSKGTVAYIDGTGGPPFQIFQVNGSASGLADLLIDAEYRLFTPSGYRPEVLLSGYWKPATASESKGLGTGTNDWIIGTELWNWFPGSDRWLYFGDLYRYFAGESYTRNVRDSWIYDVGVGCLVTPKILTKLSYWEQTSVSPGLPSAQRMNLEGEFKVNPSLTLLSEISVGMSNAAPDWSLMLGFERAF